jgi:hypothetical protein
VRSTYTFFLRTSCLVATVGLLGAQEAPRRAKMEGAIHRAAERSSPQALSGDTIRRMARPSKRLALGALRSDESRPVSRKPGLNPVGVSRELPVDSLAQGEWSITPEGTPVWRLSLSSTGAETLRVHFTGFHVGSGKVWLFGTDADGAPSNAGPYTGDGLLSDGEFWSDIVPGDSVIVAFEPAPDAAASGAPPFQILEVSHRIKKLSAKSPADNTPSAAASCNLDVTCYPEYSDPASAIALMIFESGGDSYECTGSLVSSSSQPALPFFLTANHCISDATEARSLIAIFKDQTPSCGGLPPSLGSLPRVVGASFVAGQPMELGDFSLLQLTAFPNTDVKLLGWISNELASNAQVTGISHPTGDYKRIAFGQRTRDVNIRFDDGSRMPADKGYQVSWLQGVTQSGSSGSPLLAAVDGKQYLTGTLSAGPDVNDGNSTQVCRTSNLNASYGRFSVAFPYLESILTSPTGGGGATTVLSQDGLIAAPITLTSGQTSGTTTLTWRTSTAARVQIRVGSPDGTPMTGLEGPTGSAQTGAWVTDGLTFYLQDASTGDSSGASKTLASVRAQVTATTPNSARAGAINAIPNPITLRPGQTSGTTRITWQAVGVTRVQIRVGSPTGTPMTGLEGLTGSATTGDWVTNGLIFYLQDASDGDSSGASKTLAGVRVFVR